MLGWMLKRGENASNAKVEEDTTLLDQPDTPAPVFAARAFRSVLFGSPSNRQAGVKERKPKKMIAQAIATDEDESSTPSKPPGILLTPGTGTTRRKRVSFGRDTNGAPPQNASQRTKSGNAQKRSLLAEALERASKEKLAEEAQTAEGKSQKDGSEDEWEEADDDDHLTQDMTLDLNEPHSQSGRYWKEEFQKYHNDAKAEMEKLLKYKQLAKSYAQKKDLEAIRLAELLKEEQQKVIKMEQMIAEHASHAASQQDNPSHEHAPPAELADSITKQTNMAHQYRQRVQELENQLEEFLQDKENQADARSRRRRHGSSSPTAQKTLLETQRELRRVRSQVKEMDVLRKQVSSLQVQLQSPQSRSKDHDGQAEAPRARELRNQLRALQKESLMKDEQLQRLQIEFNIFRNESETHDAETRKVLERAHIKIADLKKEVKTLKAAAVGIGRERPKSWHAPTSSVEDVEKEATGSRPKSRATTTHDHGTTATTVLEEPGLAKASKARTLREKYKAGAANENLLDSANDLKGYRGDAAVRAGLEKPKWQPFVPRSPRDRDYLREDIANRHKSGSALPTLSRPQEIIAPSLPLLSQNKDMYGAQPAGTDGIDLLRQRFASLGGPDVGTTARSGAYTNKYSSSLPPERRAAALARIEKRMAEKRKIRSRHSGDKENVNPY